MNTKIKLRKGAKPLPRIGIGTWKLRNEIAADILYEAIKLGYRHIDCAVVYGNELEVGKGIARAIQEGIVTREDLWVTSKLWCTNHLPQHVHEECLLTLKDLQLDYLDLYLIHFPIALKFVSREEMYPPGFFNGSDFETLELENVPISKTWKAMETLVDKGHVKNIGVSNFHLQLLQDLLRYCRVKPFNIQIELHPYLQEEHLVQFCERNRITVTAYSSFGVKSYIELGLEPSDEIDLFDHPTILAICKKLNRTPAQILLRWSLQKHMLSVVIPKSSSVSHLKDNLDIFSFEIDEESMKKINMLERRKRQIDQMVNFILHEAQDKAQEIEARALEEFNVEKLKLVQQKKQEFLMQLQQKAKEMQTEQAVALSLAKIEAKLQKVRAQQDALNEVKKTALEKLEKTVEDKTAYQEILVNLLLEAITKLDESNIIVQCRKVDEAIVVTAIPVVIKRFKKPLEIHIDKSNYIEVERNKLTQRPWYELYWFSSFSVGGIIVFNHNRTISIDNTLNTRIQLVFETQMPRIRELLFVHSAKS